MRRSHRNSGAYRSLWRWEAATYAAHLKRLDQVSRRQRFHGALSDELLERHAARALSNPAVRVIGWFKDGVLRGAVEIALCDEDGEKTAEAAFAVEESFRCGGVGARLMRRALLFACNRGAKRVNIFTETGNEPMIALASNAGARFKADGWETKGVVDSGERTVFSLGHEAVEEEAGVIAWRAARLRRLLMGWLRAAPASPTP